MPSLSPPFSIAKVVAAALASSPPAQNTAAFSSDQVAAFIGCEGESFFGDEVAVFEFCFQAGAGASARA